MSSVTMSSYLTSLSFSKAHLMAGEGSSRLERFQLLLRLSALAFNGSMLEDRGRGIS